MRYTAKWQLMSLVRAFNNSHGLYIEVVFLYCGRFHSVCTFESVNVVENISALRQRNRPPHPISKASPI
jgi:hypothetical protein